LAFVTVLIALDADARVSLYVFPVWALLLTAGYAVLRRRTPAAVAAPAPAPAPAAAAAAAGTAEPASADA
ncbi:proline-specific permease ProY, partial [Streptacidiphilus sp. ASG 303]|nr:proline-specific permease ProY [Streptacidiphilus sp. ASG 303]